MDVLRGLYGWRSVLKAHHPWVESEADGPNGPRPLLPDNQLCILRTNHLVVHMLPVHEGHDIGVLLNGPRLPEVTHHGPLVLPVLTGPVELAEHHDGATQLLGHQLSEA